MERAPSTHNIHRLPTALTAPPPRPREMPTQDIQIWTPRRVIAASLRTISEWTAVRDNRLPRRT